MCYDVTVQEHDCVNRKIFCLKYKQIALGEYATPRCGIWQLNEFQRWWTAKINLMVTFSYTAVYSLVCTTTNTIGREVLRSSLFCLHAYLLVLEVSIEISAHLAGKLPLYESNDYKWDKSKGTNASSSRIQKIEGYIPKQVYKTSSGRKRRSKLSPSITFFSCIVTTRTWETRKEGAQSAEGIAMIMTERVESVTYRVGAQSLASR